MNCLKTISFFSSSASPFRSIVIVSAKRISAGGERYQGSFGVLLNLSDRYNPIILPYSWSCRWSSCWYSFLLWKHAPCRWPAWRSHPIPRSSACCLDARLFPIWPCSSHAGDWQAWRASFHFCYSRGGPIGQGCAPQEERRGQFTTNIYLFVTICKARGEGCLKICWFDFELRLILGARCMKISFLPILIARSW